MAKKSNTPCCNDSWEKKYQIAHDLEGKVVVAKMNVDENRAVPAQYGIRGIPTLMVFKDGQLAATKVGAMSKAQLTAFIDQQLA